MKQILERLACKPFSFQMVFWMALGPFFLVAALCVLLMQFSESVSISFVAMSGLGLCWIWRMRGFAVASALMVGCMILEPPADLFGGICFIAPIMSALFLTALCVQEVREIMHKREVQIHNLARLKDGLEQEKQKEATLNARLVDENQVLRSQLDESKQWTDSLKRLMQVGQQEAWQAKQMRAELASERDRQQKRIKELERALFSANQQRKELEASPRSASDPEILAKLNDVRVRHFQLELLSQQYRDQLKALKPKLQLLARLKADNLQLEHRQQVQIEKACELLHKEHAAHIDQLTKEYEERIEKLQQMPPSQETQSSMPVSKAELLYNQLRVQFEAKDATLHQVRKDLYQAHGELYTANQLLAESDHLPSEELEVLYRHAQDLREELQLLEKENALLQALIGDGENLAAARCDD
ncbi:MAG: hypothetical protein H7A39_01610 [Chlamydiales bacterium]|nr:hypothetical protein [Chlamydiales bacterium]